MSGVVERAAEIPRDAPANDPRVIAKRRERSNLPGVILVSLDLTSALVCFYLVYLLRFNPSSLLQFPPRLIRPQLLLNPHFMDHLAIILAMAAFLVALAHKDGLYSPLFGTWFLREFSSLFNVMFYTLLFGMLLSFVFARFVISRAVLLGFVLLLLPVLACWRLIRRKLLALAFNGNGQARRVLVVGAGKVGRYLESFIQDNPSLGLHSVGFLDDTKIGVSKRENGGAPCILGTVSDFPEIVSKNGVNDVIITIPSERSKVARIVQDASAMGIAVHVVPEMFDLSVREVAFENIGSFPVFRLFQARFNIWERSIKRAEDIVASALLLLLFGPLMAVIAIAIMLDSKGSPIHKQKRQGLNGRLFQLLKFRSMQVDADESKHRAAAEKWLLSSTPIDEEHGLYKIVNDSRITRVGKLIRKFSLDELPQLWNVLRGDMSLVGPRPPLPYEYELYEDYQRKRLLIRPGITGLWQVSGWHKLSFEQMVLLDLRYINEWSVWLDLWIIVKTVPLVLFGRGT